MEKQKELLKNMERRPSTPGEVLRELVFPELDMSQEELAKRLGVSRQSVNDVLQEKRPVSVDMAWRLGKLLGNGAAMWINLQKQVDVWDALHVDTAKYDEIEPLRKVG